MHRHQRDATIIDLFLQTGIRPDSLVALNVDDVRSNEGRLIVRHMKGGNETAKAIPNGLMKLIADYLPHRLEMDTAPGRSSQT